MCLSVLLLVKIGKKGTCFFLPEKLFDKQNCQKRHIGYISLSLEISPPSNISLPKIWERDI